MHPEAADVLPGIGQLKGSEGGKKGLIQEKDPLLVEKATLPTGVFAVHVFGCRNLYFEENFPPEHFGIYVQITVGSVIKCTSLQLPFKKGCVVWDEIKNFSVTVSPKATSSVNEVNIAVLGFDRLQPIPKHKLLGKTEFHMIKLAKYAGDIQLELAFAYGFYGYGLCDQLLLTYTCRIKFAPKKVPHPSVITFKEKIMDLEPEFSPYYTKTNFMQMDNKTRPRLQQNMTKLSQMYSEYSQLTSRSKRIDYLRMLLQEKDVHGAVTGDQESDSDSAEENLGDVTQFGLTEALAQMANLTFMAVGPELIQEAEKETSHDPPTVHEASEVLILGEPLISTLPYC
ncbi:hypothetical protein AWC38_SpisGene8449 [Stylophora pistillata]|uniref:C2 domain-containing protein n=1 Tax=Stylophora pistillata TaxID=50429 RepID=A0A2B4SEN2_STYPI|nr:hypothetical protein AWC38_SpisGene8449 [Stylophora pistillata]